MVIRSSQLVGIFGEVLACTLGNERIGIAGRITVQSPHSYLKVGSGEEIAPYYHINYYLRIKALQKVHMLCD